MSAFEGYKQLLIGGLSGNSLVGLNFQSRWSQTDVNLYSQFCSPPQQLFPKTTSHWHPPFPPAPCSRPLFFKIDLVFVVLIRLSLPEGPREQPQRNTAWKDRTHNPCYQGGCHLACRSTNSFNTMGAIIHLNIDFPPKIWSPAFLYQSHLPWLKGFICFKATQWVHTPLPAFWIYKWEGALWESKRASKHCRGKLTQQLQEATRNEPNLLHFHFALWIN